MHLRQLIVLFTCWCTATADSAPNCPVKKIDVHHHVIPPLFRQVWDAAGSTVNQGIQLPPWTPQLSLDFMDAHNVEAAIVSLPAPATQFNTTAAASFYRSNNEYMSNLTKQYPTRFGFYAGVPSPEDPTSCIVEIRYAMEELGANGVNLLTSYGGEYLGLPAFKPVWDELDRLNAIVLIHPGFYSPIPTIKDSFLLNSGLEDWTHETTRTATHLVLTDTLRTHPNVRIILPHGGGTIPYIVNRVAQFQQTNKTAAQVKAEIETYYFDLAVTGFVEPVSLLVNFAKPAHLFYGSDFPFTSNVTLATEDVQIASVLNGRPDENVILHDGASQLFGKF